MLDGRHGREEEREIRTTYEGTTNCLASTECDPWCRSIGTVGANAAARYNLGKSRPTELRNTLFIFTIEENIRNKRHERKEEDLHLHDGGS